MLFLSRVPAPPLDAFVASVWYCENDPRPFGLERVLPHGYAQLIVNLREDQTRGYDPETGTVATSSGTIFSGIASRFCIIDTAEQECAAGVSFYPGGAKPFLPIPAWEARDRDVPLEFVWGRTRAAELREQLLEAPMPEARLDVLESAMARAYRPGPPDRAIAFALREFAAIPRTGAIAEVTDKTGLSPKRFIERFKQTVGVAPKQYCRILRFQGALASAEGGRKLDWTRIAHESGYFDQAHFIHDFRAFAGITPTGYEARRTQFRNHVNFLQSDSALPMR